MDIDDLKPFAGEILKTKIRSLPRKDMDELLQRFGTQYSFLCQRLEAFYAPDRLDRFAAIRPGGLDEIDEELRLADTEGQTKAVPLLKSFRELNRLLLPFMDAYEAQVLTDLQYMSKEELEAFHAQVSQQLAAAAKPKVLDLSDYRAVQNAAGDLRLAALMKDAIQKELKDRFGTEPE